jgi:hypothetical protein
MRRTKLSLENFFMHAYIFLFRSDVEQSTSKLARSLQAGMSTTEDVIVTLRMPAGYQALTFV